MIILTKTASEIPTNQKYHISFAVSDWSVDDVCSKICCLPGHLNFKYHFFKKIIWSQLMYKLFIFLNFKVKVLKNKWLFSIQNIFESLKFKLKFNLLIMLYFFSLKIIRTYLASLLVSKNINIRTSIVRKNKALI